MMTLEQAKQILEEVKAAPPLATYTYAEVVEALGIVAGAWAVPPEE